MRVTKLVPGTLQEGGAPFQTTHWTVVLQAGQVEADEAARKALATFSETYWPRSKPRIFTRLQYAIFNAIAALKFASFFENATSEAVCFRRM